MFIGHYAVGFASKRLAPRVSLGLLIAAAGLLDLAFDVFLLTGTEVARVDPGNTRVTPLDLVFYPYSHSLLFAAGWAAAFALLYFGRSRYRAGALAIAVAVLSHWVLDVISHRPDVPVAITGPRIGLSLWNSLPATVAVEGGLFVAGVWLYVRGTDAKNRVGRWALVALVAVLVFLYAGNVTGTPPPSIEAVAVVGLIGTSLVIAWGWWIDRNRLPAGPRK